MSKRLAVLSCLMLFAPAIQAAQANDLPSGFILRADHARLLPAGAHLDRAAVAGDILFPGDLVNAADGTVVLDYCPANSPQGKLELSGNARIAIPDRGPIATNAPGVQATKADPCDIPPFEREPEVATIRSLKELAPEPVSPAVMIDHIRALAPAAQATLLALALGDLSSPRLRLVLAAALEKQGLMDEAIDQYAKLALLWPDQPRLYKRMEQLRVQPAARSIRQPDATVARPVIPPPPTGRIHALVIGISKYEQKDIQDLSFADRDAIEFAAYLRTPRGGLGEKDQLEVLLNQDATTAGIRNRMNALKSGAGSQDTVVVFAAGHGDMWQGSPRLIAHRADPQYIGISAYPMRQFQQLLDGQVAPWARAMIFLDICHSGHLAQFNVSTQSLVPNYLMMMAANPMAGPRGKPPVANAYEDAVFGGGHGAFTYFLLRGLNTREARLSDQEFISAPELKLYVESNVAQATLLRQNPASIFNMGRDVGIADLRLPGLPGSYPDLKQEIQQSTARLRSASRSRGRASVSQPGLGPLPPGTPSEPELEARIDLENQGDEVLLKYLRGEEDPLTRDDFARAESAFRQALTRQPASPYLMARAEFCEGRKLMFDKTNYPASMEHLERSIRLDPGAAYAFNALGIAYLEQAQYELAARAFQDAIERAPSWAYPLHNLALTQIQAGDYAEAIATYRKAMSLAPQYSYLPYNLGLIYQKINLADEAQQSYEKAKSLTASRATPDIALGLLFANTGREKEAELHYDSALARLQQFPDPLNLAVARHDKAALLARHANTRAEAIQLWQDNVRTAQYLPSCIALAELLGNTARQHQRGWEQAGNDAVAQYQAILSDSPDYLSARFEMADLLTQLGRGQEAIPVLGEGARRNPANPLVYERVGDLQAAAHARDEARASWQRAIDLTKSKDSRARLQKKLRRPENVR